MCTGWGKICRGQKLGRGVCHRMPERECLKCTQTNKSTCTRAGGKVVTHERREEDGTKFKE